MEVILNILNNKLFQILLRNNFIFNNFIPEFKYGKDDKILWDEFICAVNEDPRLLEPGLVAIGLIDLIIDKENIPKKVKRITNDLKQNKLPDEKYDFENPQNLLQLYEIYLDDIKEKEISTIDYDFYKTFDYYGITDNDVKIKKPQALPEKLIVDTLCVAEFFDDIAYFTNLLTWTYVNKNLIRQDLLQKNMAKLNDENKKTVCAFLEKAGGNKFAQIINKFKDNFKRNITYQKNKAITIREHGIDGIFYKYGIIAANIKISIPQNYKIKMGQYYLKNKVLMSRLQIGANPRADFFALKEIDFNMPIKDIINLAKIQKSSATKYNIDFKLLHPSILKS